jgi:5-methyltetrahydropteroyltriglutamate--homocysteine methyltransferase
MRWSDERILTTHAGSLPRPPALVRLYARRAAGEAVDPAELDAAGRRLLPYAARAQRLLADARRAAIDDEFPIPSIH